MVEVKVSKTKNGVFIHFPKQLFGDTIPEYVTLLCGGREIRARFNSMTSSSVRYRVYSRYVPVLLSHDDCYLIVEQKV